MWGNFSLDFAQIDTNWNIEKLHSTLDNTWFFFVFCLLFFFFLVRNKYSPLCLMTLIGSRRTMHEINTFSQTFDHKENRYAHFILYISVFLLQVSSRHLPVCGGTKGFCCRVT